MFSFIAMCLVLFLVTGCAGGSRERMERTEGTEDGRIRVVCTIFPQYDFVRQIAGDRVDLKMLIHPGADVHYYEPTPQDIIAVSESDLFIYVGGESDEWADSIIDSAGDDDMEVLSMMECSQKMEEETVEGMWDRQAHHHTDGESANHVMHDVHGSGNLIVDSEGKNSNVSHFSDASEGVPEAEYDEHVWTSIENSIAIVTEIKERLCEMDEKNAAYYEQNAAAYIEELQALKNDFTDIVQNAQRKTVVFGDRFPLLYFVKEYGLEYKAAFKGCASDSEAGAETVAYLSDYVADNHIPVVFKLELSNGNIASVISRAAGAKIVTFYTCHNLSKEDFDRGETYISMMQKNAESLKEALN